MQKTAKFFLFLLVAISFSYSYAQDIPRVRKYLDTLCAPGMNGRSVYGDGEKKAATFICDRFKEFGYKPFNENYFQPFNFDINTFPGKVSLILGKNEMKPGKDFIVKCNSPAAKGKFKIKFLDTLFYRTEETRIEFLSSDLSTYCVVYDEIFEKQLEKLPSDFSRKLDESGCLVIIRNKRLTMSVAHAQGHTATFEVLKEKYDYSAKKMQFEVDAVLQKNYESQNVCAYIEGTKYQDSILLITAHYDHLGRMGKEVYFPGANDNASGVCMVLELANYYKTHPQKYSVVFIAFGAEEAGLIGSKYFTEHPLFPLAKIKFMLNLDLLGTGDEGMMVVNGTEYKKQFKLLQDINTEKNYLPALRKRGKAANSDHYFFTEKGVPAFFFYTLGGVAAYHDVYDVHQTLPLTRFKEVFGLITDFTGRIK